MTQSQGTTRKASEREPESLYDLWQALALGFDADALVACGSFSMIALALVFCFAFGNAMNSDMQIPYWLMMLCQWLFVPMAIFCLGSWAMYYEHTERDRLKKLRAQIDADEAKDQEIKRLQSELDACQSRCDTKDPGHGRIDNNPRMPLRGSQPWAQPRR